MRLNTNRRWLLLLIVPQTRRLHTQIKANANANAKSKFKLDPLRIAFFGSDHFSTESLRQIKSLHDQDSSLIDNIKLITRLLKPTGRYMKSVSELPVGVFAKENQIDILRADTQEDIINFLQLNSFNLVIAVSYGKLIPAEFIAKCKYGGLNVHPSFLPKYSGSSPLQYALLNDDQETGVTVQTLHPTKFDHGNIVAKSHAVPILENDNYDSLAKKLGRIGGELLVSVIKDASFVNPKSILEFGEQKRTLAPKISKNESQVLWSESSSRHIKRQFDALGPLFTFLNVKIKRKKQTIEEKQRVILYNVTELKMDPEVVAKQHNLTKPGDFTLVKDGLCIKANTGFILAKGIKMQARAEMTPETFIGSYHKYAGNVPQQFISTLEENK